MIPEVSISEYQAKQMEEYLEYHMSNCYDSINLDESELPEGWQSFEPYCGCWTCESREIFMATFTFLRNAGIVDIYVAEKSSTPTLFDEE